VRRFASATPALAMAVRRLCESRGKAAGSCQNGRGQLDSATIADGEQLTAATQMAARALLHTLPDGRSSRAAAQEPGEAAQGTPRDARAAAELGWPRLPGSSPGARNIAAYLLTAPRLLDHAPGGVRTQLTSLTAFSSLLPALAELAGVSAPAQNGRSVGASTAVAEQNRRDEIRCNLVLPKLTFMSESADALAHGYKQSGYKMNALYPMPRSMLLAIQGD